MKKFRRQMKTVLSAVSIVVLMIVSAIVTYSHRKTKGAIRYEKDYRVRYHGKI